MTRSTSARTEQSAPNPKDGAGAADVGGELVRRGRDAGRVEVGHDHRGPVGGEALGDRQPDAPRRTGDDCGLAVERPI